MFGIEAAEKASMRAEAKKVTSLKTRKRKRQSVGGVSCLLFCLLFYFMVEYLGRFLVYFREFGRALGQEICRKVEEAASGVSVDTGNKYF